MASHTLVTSVPPHESHFARDAFPAATVTDAPLTAALAGDHPDTSILVIAYHDRLTPDVLARLPQLTAIITRSDGFDHLPAELLQQHSVAGYHLGDYAAASVAQFAFAQALSHLRRIPESVAIARAGSWDRTGLESRNPVDVTFGVLGTGRIGARFAHLSLAAGSRVVGRDLVEDPVLVAKNAFTYAPDLPALLAEADVLSIHVPLTDATRNMIDAAALAMLPERAILVNTARGEIVDQTAAEASLRSGRLAGYAADVLPGEPHPPDLARFRDIATATITPHLAAYDTATIRERYARAGRIARTLAEGRPTEVTDYVCVPAAEPL